MTEFSINKDRKIDVIAIGRVTIDFNPNEINRPLDESRTFSKYLGGSPANVVIGLSRLGKKAGFIGKVSNDQFGRYVKKVFEHEGVDTSHVVTSTGNDTLGLTFTEMKSPTESSILMYRSEASDLKLNVSEIDEAYISKAKILLVSGTALAASPSREAVFKAIEFAKKHQVKIIFDLDYRNYTWRNDEETAIYYSLVARQSSLMIGSREEFDLTGGLLGHTELSDEEIASYWMNEGPNEIVVIKHGKEGSSAFTRNHKKVKVPAYPAKVLKSFGGGDAHGSAMIYCLLENYGIEKALHFASASAAINIGSHSSSESLPTVDEIKAYMEKVGSPFEKIQG